MSNNKIICSIKRSKLSYLCTPVEKDLSLTSSELVMILASLSFHVLGTSVSLENSTFKFLIPD